MNLIQDKLIFNFKKEGALKLSLLFFSFILLSSLISASQYSNCNIYGNCEPERMAVVFNNYTGSVNSSAYWNSYYYGDYDMPVIKKYGFNQTVSYVPYTGATNNVVLGVHNFTLDGVISFGEMRTDLPNQTLWQMNQTGDGFKMEYDYDFELANDDWLIFKKTDGNDPYPDGGIGFMMCNATGYCYPVLKMYGDGLVNITHSLLVIENITTQNIFANNICYSNGTGAYTYNNSYSMLNTSQWIVSGNDIYNRNTGKVGIGISSPVATLDVNGYTHLGTGAWATTTIGASGSRIGAFSSTEDQYLVLGNSQTNVSADRGGQIWLGARATNDTANFAHSDIIGAKNNSNSGDWSTYLAFKTMTRNAISIERMRIDGSGNVGIGTTTPNISMLQVEKAGATINYAMFGDTDQSPNIFIASNSNQEYIGAGYGYSGNDGGLQLNRFGYLGSNSAFRDLYVYDGKANAIMFVDGSSGFVGINTTAPHTLLEISGRTTTTALLDIDGNPTGNLTAIGFRGGGGSGTYRSYIGQVMAGSGIGNIVFGNGPSNANVNLLTERMRIDTSGNVGIGTTSPTQKLEVNGTALINGNLNVTGNISAQGSITTLNNVNIEGNLSVKRPYGMFSSTETQTIAVANTAYPVTFNYTEDSYLITKSSDNINFSFQQTGDYLIELSAIANTDTNNKHIEIWVQKTNSSGSFVNIPRSNTRLEIENAGTETIIAVPFIIDMIATDKFRIMWASDDAGTQMIYTTNTSYSPETPSIIMTISKISEIT